MHWIEHSLQLICTLLPPPLIKYMFSQENYFWHKRFTNSVLPYLYIYYLSYISCKVYRKCALTLQRSVTTPLRIFLTLCPCHPPPPKGVPLEVMSSITGDKPLDLFLSTKEEGERLLHTAVTQYTKELSTQVTDKPQMPQETYMYSLWERYGGLPNRDFGLSTAAHLKTDSSTE
jgi:hypothetical protein